MNFHRWRVYPVHSRPSTFAQPELHRHLDAAMLQSKDLMEAMSSNMMKKAPNFKD